MRINDEIIYEGREGRVAGPDHSNYTDYILIELSSLEGTPIDHTWKGDRNHPITRKYLSKDYNPVGCGVYHLVRSSHLILNRDNVFTLCDKLINNIKNV